jgi:hypothetical protein
MEQFQDELTRTRGDVARLIAESSLVSRYAETITRRLVILQDHICLMAVMIEEFKEKAVQLGRRLDAMDQADNSRQLGMIFNQGTAPPLTEALGDSWAHLAVKDEPNVGSSAGSPHHQLGDQLVGNQVDGKQKMKEETTDAEDETRMVPETQDQFIQTGRTVGSARPVGGPRAAAAVAAEAVPPLGDGGTDGSGSISPDLDVKMESIGASPPSPSPCGQQGPPVNNSTPRRQSGEKIDSFDSLGLEDFPPIEDWDDMFA